MVRFFNKGLKAHSFIGDEKISELIDLSSLHQLSLLFTLHVRNFNGWSNDGLTHLLQKLTIQLGIEKPTDFWQVLVRQGKKLKDLFLAIEIILESFSTTLKYPDTSYYFTDFVEDVNDFFLINKIPLQVRCFLGKREFYVEKVISPEISEEIKKTLESFSKEERI
jgi:hypothetical protein